MSSHRPWPGPTRVNALPAALLALLLLCGIAAAESSHLIRDNTVPPRPRPPATANHQSVVTIPPGSRLPVHRRISVALDKAVMIELPAEVGEISVASPKVADAVVLSSRRVQVFGKEIGESNIFFMSPKGQRIAVLEIEVIRDLTSVTAALNRLIPGSRIRAEMLAESVVLTGSVVNPVDAARAAEIAERVLKTRGNVVNLLNTAAKEQVLLSVTVAEIQRDALRRLGVDVPGSVLASGNFTFNPVLTNAFPVTSAAVPFGAAGASLLTNWVSGKQNVKTLVQALERAGLVRTLAQPNLTALSGETAKFLAGGEFPIPVSGQDRQITITFKQFGVSTSFKPVVLGDGRISLSISAEVSELSTTGAITVNETITVPSLKVRRAETTLEMPSGGTLAMAGLLSDEVRQSVEGVPGLKSVPILGALFRSNDFMRRETELVILVTPYLATHMQPEDAGRPDAGLVPPSDLQSVLFGVLNRVYARPNELLPDRPRGDFGFIVEYPDTGVK